MRRLTIGKVLRLAMDEGGFDSYNKFADSQGFSRQRVSSWKRAEERGNVIIPRPPELKKLKIAAKLSDDEMGELIHRLQHQKAALRAQKTLGKTMMVFAFFLTGLLMDPGKANAQGPELFYITHHPSNLYIIRNIKRFILSLLTGWVRFLRISSGMFLPRCQYG